MFDVPEARNRLRASLECAVALAGLALVFLYAGEAHSPVRVAPTTLEAPGGNAIAAFKLSGRGELGEIQR